MISQKGEKEINIESIHQKIRIINAICVIIVMGTFGVFTFLLAGNVGYNWDESLGTKNMNNEYCETKKWDKISVEGSNSFSNVAIIIIGEIIIGFHYIHDKLLYQYMEHHSNLILKYPIWTLLYGLTVIYVGLGSWLFHSSRTRIMQNLDVMAIYCMAIYLIVFLSFNFTKILWPICVESKEGIFNVIFIIILVIMDIGSYFISDDSLKTTPDLYVLLPALFAVSIAMTLIMNGIFKCKPLNCVFSTNDDESNIIVCNLDNIICCRLKCVKPFHGLYLFSGITLFGIALLCSNLDLILCNPNSWFQLHGFWHFLIGIGLYLIYLAMKAQILYNK